MKRRNFLASLAALVAAPKALLAMGEGGRVVVPPIYRHRAVAVADFDSIAKFGERKMLVSGLVKTQREAERLAHEILEDFREPKVIPWQGGFQVNNGHVRNIIEVEYKYLW